MLIEVIIPLAPGACNQTFQDPPDDEFQDIISMKGLNVNMIRNLPFNMNIIKIKVNRVEFLCSEFARKGYGTKQILNFE